MIGRHLTAFSQCLRRKTSSTFTIQTASKFMAAGLFRPEEPEFGRRIIGHDMDLDGQKIHFKTVGWGPKTILLMPGALGTSTTDFTVQMNEMDVKKYSLIAWDPPGHGDSRPPEKDVNDFYRRDAKKAADLMEHLAIPRYSIMGWSDGGITAMILARNESSRVDHLVIWGANAYSTPEDHDMITAIRDVKKTWSKAFRQRFEPIYGEEGLQELWDNLVNYYLSLSDICLKDLAKIEAKTLILHGDRDPLVAPEHPVFLENNIPGSKLYRFEEGRHDIHLHSKSYKEFNKVVDEFLSKQ